MPAARFQPSFAAGVLAPALHGRIDIAKYDVGLKIGTNVFVHTHGGVSNRAGTEFIAEVWDHADTYRLVPFNRDEDDNYIMVLGDQAMQIIFDGAWVESAPSTPYQPVTPFESSDLAGLDWVQSVDVVYFASLDFAPQVMSRASALSWTFAALQVDPTSAAPSSGLSATPNAGGSETYRYRVATVIDGAEGFPSSVITAGSAQDLSIAGAKNVVSWNAVADAEEYIVYRERGGSYGYIGYTDGTSFTDDNISANLELSPVQAADIFGGSGDWPSVVTLHQQRLLFAASTNEPETVWGSRIGDYQNFTKSRVTRDNERLEIVMSGEQLNRVRALLPLRDLVAFTARSEISISGPDGGLPATNPILDPSGRAGGWTVQPLIVDDTAIFIDRTGRTVRDLRYAFEQDGYAGNELTIFAQHYFEGKTIAAWAYAQSPYSVIWVVLDDGTLLSLTYKREHQVWAWCDHDVGGAVEDVAVIPEGGEDAVYFIVRRTIDGSSVRYIERLHSRMFETADDAFFVDCGVTYSGSATTTITGLDHLEGEAVAVLADGAVVSGLTVSSGEITLPSAASTVHVGLSFTAEIETLPPAIDLRDVGAARGRPHRTPRMRLQLEKTRGIKVAGNNRQFNALRLNAGDLATPADLFTGMVTMSLGEGWSQDGTVVVRQDTPLPMTVLGISPETVIGRAG